MRSREMLSWCRLHNVRVRFFSNKTVEVHVNFRRRRRKTLAEAIAAHEQAFERDRKALAAVSR